MAEYNFIATNGGTTPPYASMVARITPANSWSNMISYPGDYAGGPGGIMFTWGGGDGDIPYINSLYHTDVVFDLSSLGSAVITAASIDITTNSTSFNNYFQGDWDAAGFALVGQNEAARVGNTPNIVNYDAIYQGRINEYANKISRIALISESAHKFTFNSEGLTYINTVNTKGTLTNYAVFGICYGAIPAGVSAVVTNTGSDVGAWIDRVELNITTQTNLGKININDSWKDIEEVSINISDSWKSVGEWNLNISDIWKNT